MISVVFGSKKSKKTAFAEDLFNGYLGSKYFIASMRPLGDSDKEKVERFRKQREGKGFVTIEQDVAIVKAIDKIKWMESLLGTNDSKNAGKKAALIANIPAICANEMFLKSGEVVSSKDVEQTILMGLAFLKEYFTDIVVISDEEADLLYYADADTKSGIENGLYKDTTEYEKAMNELNASLKNLSDEIYIYDNDRLRFERL